MRLIVIAITCLLSISIQAQQARKISWKDLRPMPVEMERISPQKQLWHDMNSLLDESGPAALQSEADAPVIAEMDKQYVRIPGYIVPLEMDDDNRTREFFLVPFLGACIHVPPPPSNQIILVRSEAGVLMDSLWQPFWLQGTLRVERASNELAAAGYQMDADVIELYR